MKLADRCAGRWPEILSRLGVEDRFLTGKHVPCPRCGGKDRFRYVGDDRGGFFCSDLRGDGIELVKHVFGIDFPEAAKRIEEIVGRSEFERPAPTYAERLRDKAITATRSAYLASRGLEVAPGLRFARGVEYMEDGAVQGTYDAMLGPVTRAGRFLTYHCTYLRDGRKAPVATPRKVLPGKPISGGGIELYPADTVMGVGEGIETCIAAKMLFGIPTHAAISTSGMAKWEWPSVVRELRIFADHDANAAGHAAAWALCHRARLHGLVADVVMPPEIGDWNDVLLAQKRAA